jgi:hypothetical protein
MSFLAPAQVPFGHTPSQLSLVRCPAMASELRDFVREALTRGMPRPLIREKLLEAGWRPEEVDTELAAFAEIESPIPVPRRRPYLSARETFFYLVLFVTLYITAFNVGAVLFQLVNRAIPDVPAAGTYTEPFSADMARGAIAAIVIAFPIFLFMSRIIGRSVAQDPEKRASKIRRWLTYITLFVSACVIIGDLTFLVTRVLSGELALRVTLKVLAVLLIAGVLFLHYLTTLRREEDKAQSATGSKLPARIAGVATLVILVAGLFAVGTPGEERLRKLDQARVNDLIQIQSEIANYYRDHGRLPASIQDVADVPASGVRRTADPVTRVPYGYHVADSTTYELSATFAAVDSAGSPGIDYPSEPHFWRHPASHTVYRLTIPPGQRGPAVPGGVYSPRPSPNSPPRKEGSP